MPDIYDKLAARYLSEKRYVFPTSRRCRVSETAAVLDESTPVPMVDELALFPGLAGDERFQDTLGWYLRGTHERAAAQQDSGPDLEPVPEPAAPRVARAVRVTQGFLAAGVAGIPPADLPTLVTPLPLVVEEP